MTIKTVTTADGINVVDFGNTINEYYWFRNLGDTTIYVSNKEDFKAGDDGVSELTVKGDITNIESFDGKVYILGAGKVEIHNTDSKLPPFKSAPVAGGGGGEVTVAEWNYTPPYDPGGLLANIMNTTGYNGGGDDIGSIQGRFGFCQSYSGYNITHSTPIDLTNVKKITVDGGTVANKDSLSTTAYYCISSETITELDDRWTEIHSSTGTVVSDFIAEIDCSEITGEKFLYLAVKHGDEVSAYTSYFYIDKITLSGDGTNVKYAENAGNADTVDGLHADDFALKTDIPTSLPANGGNADTVDGLHADDFALKTDIPTSLPANGGNADYAAAAGNADTVDNKHYTDFSQNAVLSTIEQVNDPNIESGIYSAENVSMSFSSDVASNWFMLIVNKHRSSSGYGTQIAIPYDNGEQRGTFYRVCHAGNWGNWIRIADGGNADTLDGLHADDFVNANDRDQIQIPNNVDVPVWIHTNGKRFQRYMTNSSNIGLTNVPDNSTDYVWYWYDGMNIFAHVYSSGKYFICGMINGVYSGWKDVYTSAYKPYVTGLVAVDSNGKANVSFGFSPSFVLYAPTSPKSGIFGSVYSARIFNATGFTPSADTYTGGLSGNGLEYIAFK